VCLHLNHKTKQTAGNEAISAKQSLPQARILATFSFGYKNRLINAK